MLLFECSWLLWHSRRRLFFSLLSRVSRCRKMAPTIKRHGTPLAKKESCTNRHSHIFRCLAGFFRRTLGVLFFLLRPSAVLPCFRFTSQKARQGARLQRRRSSVSGGRERDHPPGGGNLRRASFRAEGELEGDSDSTHAFSSFFSWRLFVQPQPPHKRPIIYLS